MGCKWSFLLAFSLAVFGGGLALGFGMDLLAERQARLEKMSAVEKDELRRNYERLQRLDPERQQRVRALDRQLSQDPHGERLRQVMLRYHEWLGALPSAERAELLSLPETDRIPQIRKILIEQESVRLRELAEKSLSPADVDQVRAWFTDMVQRSKPQLLARLPPHLQDELSRASDRRLTYEVFNHRRDNSKGPPMLADMLAITEADRLRLVEKLSAPARDVYRQANTEQDKRMVLQKWGLAAMYSRRVPSSDELRELLQTLKPEVRDRIENLPPEQMTAELSRIFFYERMRRWGQDGKRPPFPGDRFKERPGGDPSKQLLPKEDSRHTPDKVEERKKPE